MRIPLSLLSLITSLLVIGYTYFNSDSIGEKQLLIYIVLFALGVCLIHFFRSKALKVVLVIPFFLIYSLLSFVEFAHGDLFNSRITTSTISILLETNTLEIGEFLNTYITGFHIVVALLLIGALIIAFIALLKKSSGHSIPKIIANNKLMLSLFIVSLICLYMFREHFLPIQVANTIEDYQYQKEIIESVNVTPEGNFKDVIHEPTSNKKLVVLVLGESTTRNHMSLYGYYRKTNPLLELRKDELLIYKDVISPNTHTIPSLGKALTVDDYEVPSKKYNSTLIQLFNKAGFKTYWISNQRPVGVYETSTKIISRNSDVSIYTDISEGAFDGKVLGHLKKALKDDSDEKLIVIHLMGTHVAYNRRYPETFNTFNDEPITSFKSEKAFQMINEYDNAVLYNDYVLNEIINEVEKEDLESAVLYLSDHGEEVYETRNKNGHTESKGSKPMYDIPFILWRSTKFLEKSENFDIVLDRPYSSENLPYSLAHLAKIKFDGYIKEKSIFDSDFIIEDRIILNDKLYDKVFKEE